MTTAIDSNVLIDLFQQEPTFGLRAAEAVDRAIRAGRVVACDIVWAEVAGQFESDTLLKGAMEDLTIEFDPVSEAAATKAGALWRRYRRTGGSRRDRIVPDFIVGAHALGAAEVLLTRDRGFYRRYFKGLQVIEP